MKRLVGLLVLAARVNTKPTKEEKKNVKNSIGTTGKARSYGSGLKMTQNRGMKVLLQKVGLPDDYHCECTYCKKFTGMVHPGGEEKPYHRNIRDSYMVVGKHFNLTPCILHKFAIDKYTNPGDWVFDPTVGAGTTMVEALIKGRNAIGIEIEFPDLPRENCEFNNLKSKSWHVIHGDARDSEKYLSEIGEELSLTISNPPYSGDQLQTGMGKEGKKYDKKLDNLAHLKEGPAYYDFLEEIYSTCCDHTKVGGHLIIGVKDQIRNKVPDQLHRKIGDTILRDPRWEFVETYIVPHWPPTMFMSTYPKRFPEVKVPRYQTCLVFRKMT